MNDLQYFNRLASMIPDHPAKVLEDIVHYLGPQTEWEKELRRRAAAEALKARLSGIQLLQPNLRTQYNLTPTLPEILEDITDILFVKTEPGSPKLKYLEDTLINISNFLDPSLPAALGTIKIAGKNLTRGAVEGALKQFAKVKNKPISEVVEEFKEKLGRLLTLTKDKELNLSSPEGLGNYLAKLKDPTPKKTPPGKQLRLPFPTSPDFNNLELTIVPADLPSKKPTFEEFEEALKASPNRILKYLRLSEAPYGVLRDVIDALNRGDLRFFVNRDKISKWLRKNKVRTFEDLKNAILSENPLAKYISIPNYTKLDGYYYIEPSQKHPIGIAKRVQQILSTYLGEPKQSGGLLKYDVKPWAEKKLSSKELEDIATKILEANKTGVPEELGLADYYQPKLPFPPERRSIPPADLQGLRALRNMQKRSVVNEAELFGWEDQFSPEKIPEDTRQAIVSYALENLSPELEDSWKMIDDLVEATKGTSLEGAVNDILYSADLDDPEDILKSLIELVDPSEFSTAYQAAGWGSGKRLIEAEPEKLKPGQGFITYLAPRMNLSVIYDEQTRRIIDTIPSVPGLKGKTLDVFGPNVRPFTDDPIEQYILGDANRVPLEPYQPEKPRGVHPDIQAAIKYGTQPKLTTPSMDILNKIYEYLSKIKE